MHLVARAHGVVVGLAGRALLVAELGVVRTEDAVPGPVPVVDEMGPAVVPQPVVPVPVPRFPGARRQQGGGSQGLGLHPEVLVGVVHRTIRIVAVDQAPVHRIPGHGHRAVEQLAGAWQAPVGRRVAVQDQQQLGPFGLVPGLEAPGAEDVAAVAAVVFPVHAPVGPVVFPDQAPGQRGLAQGHVVRQQRGPLQVAALAGGLERRQEGLACVHVGVLAAVGRQPPVGGGLVGVQAVLRFPEALFHQRPGFVQPPARLADAGLQRLGVGQHHEG